ncbi:hypothetical protein H4R18_001890 [Coemansia javaensis]|uniref:Uncharacterized protein n=1 Tax=Coemansia javaensis TaxID=2761396 RepID=A0A9W8HDQ7_9FUNG|nr:hypothetical protein H4R18_001890 [Coemansia javaensis]
MAASSAWLPAGRAPGKPPGAPRAASEWLPENTPGDHMRGIGEDPLFDEQRRYLHRPVTADVDDLADWAPAGAVAVRRRRTLRSLGRRLSMRAAPRRAAAPYGGRWLPGLRRHASWLGSIGARLGGGRRRDQDAAATPFAARHAADLGGPIDDWEEDCRCGQCAPASASALSSSSYPRLRSQPQPDDPAPAPCANVGPVPGHGMGGGPTPQHSALSPCTPRKSRLMPPHRLGFAGVSRYSALH